jgi:hypothetical protein
VNLTWEQVRARRLARSRLTDRAGSVVDAARDTCGIQAQLQAAAEHGLRLRGEGDVGKALWEERTLVKTWTLRGTLHIHPSDELLLWTRLAPRGEVDDELLDAFRDALDGRTLLREELAGPLGLDLYIGLPDALQARVEPIVGGLTPTDADPALKEMLAQFMGPDSLLGKALSCHGALGEPGIFNRPELRAAELPAANGVGDARSLSRLYAAVIGDVHADERFPSATRVLSPETVAAASTCQTEGNDAVLFFESTFGLGFMTSSPFAPYGGARAFGHAGAGGSLGFADPEAGIAGGYVMSKMQQSLTGDARSSGLIKATYAAAGVEPAFV